MALVLYNGRELIWRLFLRDFSSRYRQSLFGFLWALVNPLATMGIFLFLNRSGIFSVGEISVPYPVFALSGLSLYGIFSTGLSAGAASIVNGGPMIVKVNMPKIALVFAAAGQALVEFIIRLFLLIILFLIYGIIPGWGAVFFPLAVIPVLLLTLALALPFSILAGVFRDIIHFLPAFTTLFLFLLPVLYPPPEAGLMALMNRYNPLSHLITGARDILISGVFSNPQAFLWSSLFALLFFLFSWRLFFLSESKIAERI